MHARSHIELRTQETNAVPLGLSAISKHKLEY